MAQHRGIVVVAWLLVLASSGPRAQAQPNTAGVCFREGERIFGQRPWEPSPATPGPLKRLGEQNETPILPPGAMLTSGWSGELLIDPHGDVVQVWTIGRSQVVPSDISYDALAEMAIRAWKFEPMVVQGQAVPVCMTLAIFIN